MPSKARPPADNVEKPIESTDPPPAPTGPVDSGGEKAATKTDEPPTAGDGDDLPLEQNDDEADAPRPGVYRFTWPYACTYLLPDRTSTPVEPDTEVFWPDGAPDALWEYVSDEPAPAASDNTPRE